MFCRHRQGYIFPVVMNINCLESSFVSIIQKLHCTDEFIWFYSKSHIVTAASQGSLALMGVRSTQEFKCLCHGFGDATTVVTSGIVLCAVYEQIEGADLAEDNVDITSVLKVTALEALIAGSGSSNRSGRAKQTTHKVFTA